jgi:hypothetical protein
MVIYGCITSLFLYIFVGLKMSQDESKHVSILHKQGYCLYTEYCCAVLIVILFNILTHSISIGCADLLNNVPIFFSIK